MFAVRRGDIKKRADVVYAADLDLIQSRYANPLYDLVPLGTLTKVVQYGTSKRASSEPVGVAVLRIPNLQVEGWDLNDLKYLVLTTEELSTYRLEKGDILFNRTNGSRELVGKCEVFNFDGDWVFASYLIRLRIDTATALPEFVTAFLNSFWGRRQVEHVSRQILMSNINAQEIRALRIPLPELTRQRDLIATLNACRVQHQAMLVEADSLLSGLDEFVLVALGLKVSVPDIRNVYGVLLREARTRLDPDYNSPRFRALRQRIDAGPYQVRSIGSLFSPILSGFAAGRDEQTADPTLGIPHIRPLNISNTAELHFDGTKMVPRSSVSPESLLRLGEVLFNNTNSTAWVGKTVVFDSDRECACSNHITRLSLVDKRHDPYFFAALFNALRGLGLFGLLATNFNNQAGVNVETLKALRVPIPDPSVQHEIAAEVSRRRNKARQLHGEAVVIWENAKRRFEEALLGPVFSPQAGGNAVSRTGRRQ